MFGRFNREGRERHFGHEGRERHAHDGFGHGWRFGRHGRRRLRAARGPYVRGRRSRLVILAMLAEKPSYGYELIKGLASGSAAATAQAPASSTRP